MKLDVGNLYKAIDDRDFYIYVEDYNKSLLEGFQKNGESYVSCLYWIPRNLKGKTLLLADFYMNGPEKLNKWLCLENMEFYYTRNLGNDSSFEEVKSDGT